MSMMKFRKGDLVEILRRESEHDGGSWFPGHVVSVRDSHFLVKYETLLVNDGGDAVMEKVSKLDVRPRPPLPVKDERDKWRVGDVAEVFDVHCWRIGKIVKELKKKKNNNFVVKLSGSIQLKEFHVSDMRVQQVWHKNKWFLIGKDAQSRPNDGDELASRKPTVQPVGRRPRVSCSKVKENKFIEQENKMSRQHERSSKDLVIRMTGFNQRPIEHNNVVHDVEEARSPHLFDVATEECSVASCSSNDFAYSRDHDFHRSSSAVSENSDAESSFPSLSARKQSSGQNLDADVHALEFHAYKSTVKALYASGPLSWEQELLLSNLRHSLHISDEEHLLQLRHLLSH
ncbi:hypothetical protein LINPERPRIM_LOCUS14020 [Linum perenne]